MLCYAAFHQGLNYLPMYNLKVVSIQQVKQAKIQSLTVLKCDNYSYHIWLKSLFNRECSGSVVECLSRDRGVAG